MSNSYYRDGAFNQGTTYDLYVRSNCGGEDWSPWAGPSSFYADHNANLCRKPLSISAYRNGAYINVEFTPDGENRHEINFNVFGSPDTDGIVLLEYQWSETYGTFSSNTTYYVWVRAICDDGSRTDWTGPSVVN